MKYGQKFYLECTDRPLLLFSAPKNPLDFNPNCAFKLHGEIKQCVGLKLQDTAYLAGNAETITKVPNTFCLWHCYHINPDIRFETIGEYIPVCTFDVYFYKFCGNIIFIKLIIWRDWQSYLDFFKDLILFYACVEEVYRRFIVE